MGVHNEKKYIDAAIESIIEQTYEKFEFIIVDDASTDNSVRIIESYEDDRIHLIRNETNQGLTVSLNRALDYASGTYIARQDADDISNPHRLKRQVSFLENNAEIALVGTGAYLIDGNGAVLEQRVGYCKPEYQDFLNKSHIIHGSILGRRGVFEKLDGYDEFFRYGQDYDLWLRLSKQYNVANIPEPLYKHRIHNNSVYFSRKDESALYAHLARDIATGRVDPNIKNEINNIASYYEHLDSEARANFHADLATRYLRYGHLVPARQECHNALLYRRLFWKPYLLAALSYSGSTVTDFVRTTVRHYLNIKTRVLNYIKY